MTEPRVPRRDIHAEEQIAGAREEPTPAELDVERMDEVDRLNSMRQAHASFPSDAEIAERGTRHQTRHQVEDTLVLSGPELAAYRRLQAAAKAAHAAQESMAGTGQALRDAIGEMCKAVTK